MVGSTENYEHHIEAAGLAFANGDRAAAERSLRAAIESVEGPAGSSVALAAALVKLGALKREMGSHSDAEELFRRALDIGERALGSDDLGIVPALTGLGAARIMRGASAEAEPLLTRALDICERQLGEDHPDLVILLNDLSRLYLKQSAHAYAEPLLQRLLEMKRSKGEEHPEVATVLASLAGVRQALGRHEAAEQLLRRVLSIRERTLAPNHFAIATALEQLAGTCAARGKLRESLQLFQRALSIRELTLGAEHASLRTSRERIADLQLQASEDSHDTGAMPAAQEPRRLLSDPLGVIAASAPSFEEVLASPAPGESATNDAKPQRTGSLPYLDVLRDIGKELEAIDQSRDVGERARTTFASVGAFLRQRRAAAIIGVGVVTLPLAAWAVAEAARSGPTSGWTEHPIAAEAPVESIPGSASRNLLTISLRDSAAGGDTSAPGITSQRPRTTDAGNSARRQSENGGATQLASVAIRTLARPSMLRVDSVVGAMRAPARGSDDPFPIQLTSLSGMIDRPASALAPVTSMPTRARVIGPIARPAYPDQLLRGGVGGEVRVRFDVDTMGRPVMSTFAVLVSAHALLSAAVRRIIPDLQFEPARMAGPESRPMVERVELEFQFNPRAR